MKGRLSVVISALLFLALVMGYAINLAIASTVQPAWLPTPREETLVMHDIHEFVIFDSFNPFIPNGHEYQSGHYQACVEFLWYINYATGETVYWLITGWKYNEDYTVITLNVRPGVTWNDGKPFTARDIVFTLNMVKENSALYWHDWAEEWVEEAYAKDDLTAVIKMKKPNPRIHYTWRAWAMPIVPEHVWKNVDPTTFKNNPPVWTGPYKLKAVYPDLKMYVWERRDDYWAKNVMGMFPEPKYVVMRTTPPVDALFTQYVKGETDLGRDLPMEMIPQAASINSNCTWVPFYDPCPRGIWINCAKYPLNMPEVRWAISYCVNREKLSYVWPSLEEPPTVPATIPFADWASLAKYKFSDVLSKYKIEYNPEKAKQILDNLNFIDRDGDGIRETPNGTVLSWTILTASSPGQFEYEQAADLVEELKKIGVDASLKTVASAVFWDMLDMGEADIASYWLCTSMPWNSDIYYLVEPFHSKYAEKYPIGTRILAGEWVRLKDPELDEVIDKLAVIDPSHPDYMDLAKQALEIYMRDLPAIPVVQTIYTMAWQKTYWTNWPEKGNFHSWPPTWWPNFLFVILNLKSTRKVSPPTYIYVTVYAKASIPAFTGVDGKTYGPFEYGDALLIPKEDAERLIEQGLASYSPPVPAEIPEIAKRVSDLLEKTSRLETSMRSLEGSVSDLKGSIDALSGQMAGITTTIVGMGAIIVILVIIAIVMPLRKK